MDARFHFLTPVWGEAFTKRYTEIFLPAQLSNIQACPGSTYKIICTPEAEETIRASRTFAALQGITDCSFLRIRDAESNYARMSLGYEIGMADAPRDTPFMFLTPDSVWSDGTFSRCLQLIRSGYRAIMISGPRVSLESFLPEFSGAPISGRELSRLTERHLHPIIRSYMRGQPFHNAHPAALYWQAPGGLVARHFVFHPLVVRPRRSIQVKETLDYNIASFIPRREIYVSTDSDEMLGVDVAAGDYLHGIEPGELEDEHIVRWLMSEWPTAFHRWLGTHTVYVHSGDVGAQQLQAAKECEETMARLRRQLLPQGLLYSPVRTLKTWAAAPSNKTISSWHRRVLRRMAS